MPRRPFRQRNPNLVDRKIAEFVEWKGKLEITEYGQMFLPQKKANRRDEAVMPAWMKKLSRKHALRVSSRIDLLKRKERKYAMALRMRKPERMDQLDKEIRSLKAQIALLMGLN